ncbi:Uncharacterised protein (plasmid) [Tsukamurella tyrosinosolvens]|uniref:Uncharacterized protein n=1 Tax=Tsukamurella tyrosinosolvens TaxID=57704 RepID=A0A1H4MKW0_TSUTY|nr:hypothetical protein SAMN04489793_0899 [Tsukamurella tyrosinosolvens]VEI00879.1 Uncharacterised protein [Tsukamurella tyrosinosolvens]
MGERTSESPFGAARGTNTKQYWRRANPTSRQPDVGTPAALPRRTGPTVPDAQKSWKMFFRRARMR